MARPFKKFDKVEKYWGTTHDVIDVATRQCVATFWTLDEAKKEAEYFEEYVGTVIPGLLAPPWRWTRDPENKKIIYSQKSKDGVWDIVVNAKKFNREVFNEAMGSMGLLSHRIGSEIQK